MKRKNLLLLGASLMLAACGGRPGPTSEPAAPTSEPAQQTSEPAAPTSEPAAPTSEPAPSSSTVPFSSESEIPDNVTISFWSTGSQGMTEKLGELADAFEQAVYDGTGKTVTVEVKVEGGYDDIADKIISGLTPGILPNMAIAYPDTVANIMYQEGNSGKEYLYNIEPYMEDPNIGFGTQEYLGDTEEADMYDIVEAFLEEGHNYSREGYYSYPFMKSSEVMFYYQDYVEAAYAFFKPAVKGRDNIRADLAKMTWDEFEDLMTCVMNHRTQINDQIESAVFYDSDSNWFITQMFQKGIPFSSIKDGQGSIDFESGEARVAAEELLASFKALRDDHRIDTKGIENKYGSDFFKDEKILFSIGSSGGTGYQMPEGLSPDDIGVVPVPRAGDKDHVYYVSQGPTICFLKNPTVSDEINDAQMYYSWQFAKFLTNTENNVDLCISGSQGYIPIRYSSYETTLFVRYLRGNNLIAKSSKVLIEEIMGNYYNTAVFPGSANLRDEVGAAVTSVLVGQKTPSGALSDAINNTKTHMQG